MLEELLAMVKFLIKLYCDNKVVINIFLNLFHLTKDVEVDRYFIKEEVEYMIISMTHVPTKERNPEIFSPNDYLDKILRISSASSI